MKIRTDLPDDFYDNGFTPETDRFKKSELAEQLTKLYGKFAHGTVSILDGRWGIGKSVFAYQWQHQLQSRCIPCIYFDAFAADYVESPFRAVASAFVRAAKDAKPHDDASYDRFLTATSKALKIIAAPAAKMAVKAVTLGLVGSSEIEGLKAAAEDVASGFSDISEEAVKAMLEEQAGDEASFAELRKSLDDLPELLAKKLDADQGRTGEEGEAGSRSLVVIIDELDRCRPDFALGVMEVLKHFFRAERVHFVLVTNLNHLLLSVQKRYGVGDAAGEYLQKFYDFIIPFEGQQPDSNMTNSGLHALQLLQKMLVGANTPNVVEYVVEIVNAFDLSLRQAERVVINVVLAQIDLSNRIDFPFPFVLLAVLKAVEPAQFADIKKSRLNTDFLQQLVEKGKWSSPNLRARLLRSVRYYSAPEINVQDPEYKGFESSWNFNFNSRLDILPHLANNVIDRFG
jgi:hypothetical protein